MRLSCLVSALYLTCTLAAASPWGDFVQRRRNPDPRAGKWSVCVRPADFPALEAYKDATFQKLLTAGDCNLETLSAAVSQDLWAPEGLGPGGPLAAAVPVRGRDRLRRRPAQGRRDPERHPRRRRQAPLGSPGPVPPGAPGPGRGQPGGGRPGLPDPAGPAAGPGQGRQGADRGLARQSLGASRLHQPADQPRTGPAG